MVYESIVQMIAGVSIFGLGMTLGILGILFGVMRGMSKNADVWAITFSAFAWAFALAIPNPWWASSIFLAGAIGITTAFMPIMKELQQSSIFGLAIVAAIMNIILLVGLGAYDESITWGDNFAESQTDIENLFNVGGGALTNQTPGHGLCSPNDAGLPAGEDNICDTEALQGSYNPLYFDPIAGVITMGKYVGKGIKFAGMAVLAPIIISQDLKTLANNTLVIILIGIYANVWNLVILWQVIRFMLNRRGER